MTDDDWLATKMEFMSQCHEAIGSVASQRENYTLAEESFRKSLEMAAQPVPFTMYNLALVLSRQDKKEEAAKFADQCIAAGGVQAADGSDLCAGIKSNL